MKHLIISQDALRHNLSLLREKAGSRKLIASLCRDAYGLGLLSLAQFYYGEGLRSFLVETAADAHTLRGAGFTEVDILVLFVKNDPAELELLLETGAAAAIGNSELAMTLSSLARTRGTVAEVQLRIDSGTGGFGFLPSEIDKISAIYEQMDSLAVTGLFTEYDAAAKPKLLPAQGERFEKLCSALNAKKMETGTVHAADASILFDALKELPLFDAVRLDGVITGLLPGKTGLIPAARLRGAITEIHWLPEGARLSGRRPLKKALRLGLLPIGLLDGLSLTHPEYKLPLLKRLFPAAAPVLRLADGKKLRVAGRPGPMHTAVDTGNLDIGIGTELFAEVEPLFCTDAERLWQ